jgi:predicted N-acetyltransferase YhbS
MRSGYAHKPVTMADFNLEYHLAGFFVAVATATNEFIGTIHAQFNPRVQNSDGTPFAWIANLTTDPTLRRQRVGRALLTWGIAHLHKHTRESMALLTLGCLLSPGRGKGVREHNRL